MVMHPLVLRGKKGVKRLGQWGPYAVIVNRKLHDQGKADKYTVVNVEGRWLDSVHHSSAEAASQARQRYRL